ncbi:hypothetical protein P5V19_16875 [Mycobacteroides abscessus subsp. abscessus]|uniref:hypothetical protein n=1 Tax=Mycobacteroides abscessus TaxID=36809 RepID=UPI00265909EF|nr:hypothetical protein [Mycobacteroides abscessus]MDO3074765.1 hypothetical protein [Mycobacteroides abscessus subsp. abscessus]MDO3288262.1 hypothetical protein [Mycobacteroides abscessus subsp. abscessus]MDO3296541.1 hypothetical protein [Mycobacteroides abscessus subsp. abscessus]WKE39726.1 hypothetical protein P3M62_01615 [Mycobacteroides abscessus subsp. abscessus]
MITQPANIGLPSGADDEMSEREFEDQGDTGFARLVWSNTMPLPERLANHNIQAVIAQRPDGTIVTEDPSLAPRVYLWDTAYEIVDARAVAKALTDAANLADRWCGSLDIRKLSDRELLEILPELEFVDGRGEALRETVKNIIHLGDVARQWVYQELAARGAELP